MATAACCRRMSACSWSACDERSLATGPMATRRSSISPARACGGLQYFRRGFCAACGSTELTEKRASGEGTVYATSLVLPRRDAGDARACALQYRAGRYRGRLSHDGAWRRTILRSATTSPRDSSIRRPAGSLFREVDMSLEAPLPTREWKRSNPETLNQHWIASLHWLSCKRRRGACHRRQ